MTLRDHGYGKNFTSAFELFGGVDPQRDTVYNDHVDPHAGLERAQLLELLAMLQWRGSEGDKTSKRPTAKGVNADVMKKRSRAPRRGRAGEIKRAQPARRHRSTDDLHHIRI